MRIWLFCEINRNGVRMNKNQDNERQDNNNEHGFLKTVIISSIVTAIFRFSVTESPQFNYLSVKSQMPNFIP